MEDIKEIEHLILLHLNPLGLFIEQSIIVGGASVQYNFSNNCFDNNCTLN